MKRLPVFLNTPAGIVIAAGLIVLVCEFSIMLLIGDVLNPIFKDKVPNIFWEFIDPIALTAIRFPRPLHPDLQADERPASRSRKAKRRIAPQ